MNDITTLRESSTVLYYLKLVFFYDLQDQVFVQPLNLGVEVVDDNLQGRSVEVIQGLDGEPAGGLVSWDLASQQLFQLVFL